METSTAITLGGAFLKLVGNELADIKSRRLADIDLELLELKQTVLSEKLEAFKADLDEVIIKEKARVEQDMISRGLANTTVRSSQLHAIDQEAKKEVERATLEYNRAIEEIALLKRKVAERSRPWWKRIFRPS